MLRCNALLHREAARDAVAAVYSLIDTFEDGQPVAVLDLACGGRPRTIADVMGRFHHGEFHYTGMDINPDQIAQASSAFPFPANVTETRLVEGNAWQLDHLPAGQVWQLVFSGMNIHHGTPAEITWLGMQLRDRLAPGGLLVSHDVFRPDGESHVPRPGIIDGEPSALVAPEILLRADIPALDVKVQGEIAEPAWRLDYLQRMRHTLLNQGADKEGVESSVQHMRSRDFPVSTVELEAIMVTLGFEVWTRRYDESNGPMGPYIGFCVATPRER